MNTELKQTLQFVFFIATPLCLVNSFITSDKFNLWNDWGLNTQYHFLRQYFMFP
ncbi:hypothetical protein [Capnocytophaga genosp. AHN8471]|uniref:hypothetical protein n=1 Tax=Capnocytophaga genosp. AHN8471 TaxID=327574 RepID=UPI001EE3DDB8|nr:hypothetical protein [Capnocytophaga genosp. AHN8471]